MVTIVEQLTGVPREPTPPLEPTQPTTAELRQQQIQQGLSRIDQEITIETQRLTELIQRLEDERADPTSTSASRGAIDDRIGESRRLLTQLGRARTNIAQGFTFESAVSRATQLAVAQTRAIESRRRIEQTPERTIEQQIAIEQAGRKITGVEFLPGQRVQLPPPEQVERFLETTGIAEAIRLDPSLGLITPVVDVERDFTKEFVGELIAPTAEFLFGEKGKPFVGIGLPGVPLPIFSVEDIRGVTEERLGFPGAVVSELLTTVETPGAVAITGAIVTTAIVAPPIVGVFITTGVAGLSFKSVLDPELTAPQRVAAGLVGVTAVGGLVITGIPFIRGIGAKPVKIAPEGFPVIKGVKGVGDIGLIQPGKGVRAFIDLPKTSPLVRGGFGRRRGGEEIFIGAEQLLATSQRAFFKIGKEIPIERPFFVTPQEPFLKIAETRISRLGLVDLFKAPKEIEIGFGIPKAPQIGVTIGEVARVERARAFVIGKGTELEAIKTRGIITDIEKIGRARIKGEGVDIFEFKLGVREGRVTRISTKDLDFRTTRVTTRIPGETLISALVRRPTIPLSRLTIPLVSPIISPPISPRISPPISPPTIRPTISLPPTRPITPTLTPPTISPPIISPPTFPPIKPPTPPKRFPRDKRRKPIKIDKVTRRKTPIRPSFTAIVAELRGGLPEIKTIGELEIGILPTHLRRLPKKKRKKKKKSKKKS